MFNVSVATGSVVVELVVTGGVVVPGGCHILLESST